MWTVIYIAPNKQSAETLRDALSREGILASLRPTGVSTLADRAHYELMVPEGEAREAHEILNEALGRARFKR